MKLIKATYNILVPSAKAIPARGTPVSRVKRPAWGVVDHVKAPISSSASMGPWKSDNMVWINW